jgi:hypothetical protein
MYGVQLADKFRQLNKKDNSGGVDLVKFGTPVNILED